ncbi:MAG: SEC-C metal-binding domain-containing protein, partial [Prevotella sp.]
VPNGDDQMFEEYQPLVERLVDVQRKLATQLLAEAKQKINEGIANNDQKLQEEGFLCLFRSHKALPKNKPLIKFLSEDGIKSGMLKTEEYYMENNNRHMPEAVEPLYFVVDEKLNSVDLTDKGTEWLAAQVKDKKLFVLPDITTELAALENETELTDEQKLDKKDQLFNHYALQSERVHTLQQLLKAYTMFNKDDEYVVIDGEVKIVDEQTGRIMEGRQWSDGLHQAVEAKEHVKVKEATQTFATITLQNYFRMYHKLAGMTGTASTEAGEFWNIYKLDVVEIPTNKPVKRNDMDDRVYKTEREKYNAVIEEIEAMRNTGRPCLVGTTSVIISEKLSKMLDMRHIPHKVLNAKLHQQEANVVAEAGRSTLGKVTIKDKDGNSHIEERMLGAVTIATNMAGRGTDIKLTPEVKAAGGLAIIGTERHESRRVDRQLRGRAGRQGDPGSSVFYISLEDKLMRLFASERIARIMDRLGFKEGERIESPLITKNIERAQKKVEENNFGIRKRLLEYDDVMNRQRKVIYEKRRHALIGERIGMDITNIIWDRVVNIIERNDYEGCKNDFLKVLSMECPFTEEELINTNKADLEEQAFQMAMANFKRKTEKIQSVGWPVIKEVFEKQGSHYERIMVPITDGKAVFNIPCKLQEAYETEGKSVVKQFEKTILLHIIDDCWKENLRALDELKHSVQNASYEQKDPLIIFKLESVKLFDDMVDQMNNRIVGILMRGQIPEMQQGDVKEAAPEQHSQRYNEQKDDLSDPAQRAAANHDTRESAEAARKAPIRKDKLPGRNDPCPCGSGKKFKNCHGRGLV